MTRRNPLFLAVLVCLFLLAPGLSQAKDLTVRFLRVIDGDSIQVEYKHDSLEVRLIGIDAPEFKQEYGRQAKEFSLRFCYGKPLRLEFDKELRDHYDRFLAYVYVDDEMLNEEIVRAGLAIPIRVKPNTRHYERFKEAEKEAREKRRGFWIRGGLKQTPAQWRKSHPR